MNAFIKCLVEFFLPLKDRTLAHEVKRGSLKCNEGGRYKYVPTTYTTYTYS